MSASPEPRPRGGDAAEDRTEGAARSPARPSPSDGAEDAGAGAGPGPGPGPGSLAPSPGSPAAAASPAPWPEAQPPASLWLELEPPCGRAQQCPSESSGQTSGDLGTSSSSGGGSSAGLSPASDSDSSGVVCGGRGGLRGARSRSWSLESLRSATAGKGAARLLPPARLSSPGPLSPPGRLPFSAPPFPLPLLS